MDSETLQLRIKNDKQIIVKKCFMRWFLVMKGKIKDFWADGNQNILQILTENHSDTQRKNILKLRRND